MKLIYFPFVFCILLIAAVASAQPYFQWNDSIPVKINGNYVKNPWAGGLNSIQASNIDLNMDGILDLFVFERTGNKIRTFINNSTVNIVDLKYEPEYENKFPLLHDWALLIDYNCDGKEDIFTYSSGGFAVYKNTSDNINGLQFTLVTPLQLSNYSLLGGQLSALYISPVDVPSFSDIDGDGDMDVVTFISSSNYLQYHQNQSVELYGTCDSLVFEIKNRCWGYVSENPIGNNYTLYDTCAGNVVNPELTTNSGDERSEVHSNGGCSLCIDLDDDGDKDFISGVNSYYNLTMLTNGGSAASASFIAKDNTFPSNNGGTAVNIPVYPCAYSVDVNNDGIRDLIVSPNAPYASENYNSVLYYQNIGTGNFPVFQFQQTNLLQDNMIDVSEGAYPVFFDYDNDGLKDLFIGNYGYYITSGFGYQTKIAQFKNTGTITDPQFELITRNYANLSSLGINNMVPTFGDLDADGDSDMIIGGHDGKLHYFENTASAGDPANFVLAQANLRNADNRVIDIGDFATPQIADVDGDMKNDLVIGGRNGKLAYYNHIGNATAIIPTMDSISHFFGNIKVNRPGYFIGYSYPFVFRQNGITKMLVGEESGNVRLYDNIDGNLTGSFSLVDSTYENIFQGTRTSPNGADIDNDGYMDLIVGNYAGGVSFYKGVSTSSTAIISSGNFIHWSFDLFPNPSNTKVTIKIRSDKSNVYKFELYTVMGQLLISHKIVDNNIILSTENLPQGIYFCKIVELNTDSSLKTFGQIKRLIVQHY